jgi:CheY-like chemotaxis protein
LPHVSGPAIDYPPEPALAGVAVARGTVLVAEDEEPVRNLIARSLSDAGYTVLLAQDGEEALEVARRATSPIDLVVTDVVMPRLGGRELATRLAAASPALRVLFVSGYASDSLAPADLREPGTEYLPKPFTPLVLLDRVRKMLDIPGTGLPSGETYAKMSTQINGSSRLPGGTD